jgi:hypothetical protein
MQSLIYAPQSATSLEMIAQAARNCGFETQMFDRWDAYDQVEHKYLNLLLGNKTPMQFRNQNGDVETRLQEDYCQWTRCSEFEDLREVFLDHGVAVPTDDVYQISYHSGGFASVCAFIKHLAKLYGGHIVTSHDNGERIFEAAAVHDLLDAE